MTKRLTIIICVTITAAAIVVAVLMFMRDDNALLFKNDVAVIDARQSDSGTVTVKYSGFTQSRLKAQVTQVGGRTQNYNLPTSGAPITLPLHGGSGDYIVKVCEQVENADYTVVFYAFFSSECDDYAPYLRKNLMVFWENDGQVENAAKGLAVKGMSDAEVVQIFLEHVADAIDYEVSEAVVSGYIPAPDGALFRGSGVCSDYAAALCAMLRVRGVPAKLVFGWAGEVYHAWVSAYYDDRWNLLDPTFVSSADERQKVLNFVADEQNYKVVYEY